MTEIIKEIRESFSAPFYTRGCSVVDSKGYILCTLSNCMLTKEQGKRLADKVAEMLNDKKEG